MMLFFAAALLTLLALAVMLRPLLRDLSEPPAPGRFNRAVYRDQLRELDGDVARQSVVGEDAASARREIERRLAREGGLEEETRASPPPVRAPRAAAAVLAGVLALGAGGGYLALGSPEAAVPRGAASAASAPAGEDAMHAEMDDLVAKLSQRLRENPDDAAGWALLARSQIRLGRTAEAVAAYAEAMRLTAGADRQLTAEYAEARVMALGGEVDAESRTLFQELRRANPNDPQARYYLALARGQAGDLEGALREWRALRADSPEGAPWLETLDRQIALAEGELGGSRGGGPTAADVSAAQALSPSDRAQMIEGMVAGLAARLEREPNDLAGWRRLAQAYDVLGQAEEAARAHARVLTLAPGDGQALWRLGELAAARGDRAEARARWTALSESRAAGPADRARAKEALAGLR